MNQLITSCFLFFSIGLIAQVKNLTQPGFQWHEPTAWSPVGVPTANDSVFIGGATFIMPDSVARARYVSVHAMGSLDIQRDVPGNIAGRLIIQNAPGKGLDNEGQLTIGGRLTIKNSGNTALVNLATITILDKAKLIIDSTTSGIGIYNLGNLASDGTIEVIKVTNDAIRNTDTISFSTNSVVTLEGSIQGDPSSNGIANNSDQALLMNEGLMTISGFIYYGIQNLGEIINMDTISVIHNDGGGMINYTLGTFNNFGFLNFNDFTAVGIINQGILDNNLSGKLLLQNIEGNGLENSGTINNSGVMSFRNIRDTCLINSDRLVNSLTGNFAIDSSTSGPGIYNMNFFLNEGVCHITQTNQEGMINFDSLVNTITGTLMIDSLPDKNGILNQEDGLFQNWGTTSISEVESANGIKNYGITENYGELKLDNINEDGITNYNQFVNGENSLLSILHTGDYAIQSFVQSLIENYGRIKIDSVVYGIYVRGRFINEDTISFNVMEDYSFEIFDTLMNNASGLIEVVDGGGNTMIYNGGFFENSGSIQGQTNHRGIINTDLLVNEGEMFLFNSISKALQNFTDGILNNQGIIHIENSAEGAIVNQGVFSNSNMISVLNSGETGLTNTENFLNTEDATILINGVGENYAGIENGQNSSDILENMGVITIDGGGVYGIFSESQLIIGPTGEVHITNTIGVPLEIQFDSTFDCFGILNIED